MTSEQLKATLTQQPFRPCMIRMVDGRAFTVSHPEWVIVSPTGRTAILFAPDDSCSVVDSMLMNELEMPASRNAGHASGEAARIPSPCGSGFPAAGVMFVCGSHAAAAATTRGVVSGRRGAGFPGL